MPIKKKDWAKILRSIGIVGETMGGLARIKEYRAQQEAEEQKAKAEADFWAERIKNPLNIETVGGTPMVAPSGKPLGAAVLSGAYDKYQRESDVRLLEKYRMLKITPPEWLKARLKPIGQVTAKYVLPKKEKPEADFWAERIKNPLNIETVGGTPMVAPSGKPLGAAVLSGAYDKYQRESDARLLEKYRMLKITPPEWLKARLKPIGQVTAKYVPPKKEKPKEPTETEKNILAHLAVQRKTATPEQVIRAKLSPFPGANKKAVKDVVRGEQEKWDRDVRNYVNQDKNNFPRMQELLLSGGQMFITPEMAPRDPALKEWGKKERIGYEREKIAIANIFGMRPEMPEDPEITKAKKKLQSGEWDQATYNDFIKWYQTE